MHFGIANRQGSGVDPKLGDMGEEGVLGITILSPPPITGLPHETHQRGLCVSTLAGMPHGTHLGSMWAAKWVPLETP